LRKRLWDFFISNYDLTAIFVNLLLIVLTGIALHASQPYPWTLPFFILLLLAVAAFDFVLKKGQERSEALRLHKEFIANLLDAASASLLGATQPPLKHMRVCVMFPEGNDLRIRYAHGFAPDDMDRGIRVPIGTGCCGQAWLQGKPMTADLTEAPLGGMPGHWGMPPEEAAKVRGTLKSVLSVPVRAGVSYDVVAMLNMDSDNSMAEVRFVHEDIQYVGYCYAKALGSLMDEVM
jgi:hypothetical protein